MSYYFDGSGDSLIGTLLDGPYTFPLTIACWVKFPADHPLAFDQFLQVGNSSSSNNTSFHIRTNSTDNQWSAGTYSDAGGQTNATATHDAGTNWVPVVGTVNASGVTTVYVNAIGTTDVSGTPDTITEAIGYIKAGENLAGGADFTGYLAELAMWSGELSSSNITSYLAGNAASLIDAANLILYAPLSSNANVTAGSDSITALTAQGGAAYNAAHPTISSALTYLKLTAHADAASATGVAGWVVGDDNTTYYGYFSGQSFEAALESGEAVLKVLATDIAPDGGDLTTSDTPQVVIRNTTYGTTMCDATVIEE